jgi:hypothetical protein
MKGNQLESSEYCSVHRQVFLNVNSFLFCITSGNAACDHKKGASRYIWQFFYKKKTSRKV